MNCDFRAYEVSTNSGFTAEGRRTRVEPVNLVIIHIMQHHLSHRPILRCVVVGNGFLVIQRQMTLKVYNIWKLHWPRIWGRFVSW